MIVGEASVVIRAVGNKLESDIQKSLDRAGIKAGKSGEGAGKNYSEGFSKGFDKNSGGITDALDKKISSSTSKIGEKTGKRIAEKTSSALDRDTKTTAAGERLGRKIGDRVSRGFERSRIARTIGNALVKIGVFIPIIGALVGGVSALVSGLFAVGAAVGTASSALVALPGVLAAGLQGILVAAVAFKGVGKAISEGFKSDNLENFNKALEKIAPAARPFVKELVGLKSTFVDIRNAAAEGLFPGLESALSRVAPLLSKMTNGFREAGKSVGLSVDNFARITTTPFFKGDFKSLADQNNKVIERMGIVFGNLAAIIVSVLDAAGPLVLRFSDWLVDATTAIRNMTQEGNNSGKLAEYFNKAGDAAALLGRIFGNVVEGLYDIGKIASPIGMDLLRSFEGVTENLANFTDESKNVSKTSRYFKDVAVNVKAIGGLVKDLGAAFIRMGASPGIAATAEAFRKIIPELEAALTQSVETIGPAIAKLIGKILELFTVLEESGAIKSIIDIFTGLATALTTVFNIPGIGPGLLALLKFVAIMKALKFVMKGGGFVFNGVVDGFGSLRRGANTAIHPIQALQRQSIETRKRFAGLGVTAATLSGSLRATSGGMDAVTKSTQRTVLATQGYTVGTGRAVGVTSRLLAPLSAVSSSLGGFATRIGTATAGLRRFGGQPARVAGQMALIGAASTGVAKKVGLANTVMFAAIGSSLGPWGAAAGAAAGLAMDLSAGASAAGKAIKNANAAMRSNDPQALAASYEELGASIASLRDRNKSTGIKDWFQDEFSNIGTRFKLTFTKSPFDIDGQKLRTELEKETKASIAKQAAIDARIKINLDTQIVPTLINASNTLDAIKQFKNEVDANGKTVNKFTVEFGQKGYAETLGFISQLGQQLKTLPAGPAKDAVRKQLLEIGEAAKLSGPALDLLTDKINGVPPAINKIDSKGKVIKLTADDKALLTTLGYTEEQLAQLEGVHNANIGADLAPGTQGLIDSLLGDFGEVENTDAKGRAGVAIDPNAKNSLAALLGATTEVGTQNEKAKVGVTVQGNPNAIIDQFMGPVDQVGNTLSQATVGVKEKPGFMGVITGVVNSAKTAAAGTKAEVEVGAKPKVGLAGIIGGIVGMITSLAPKTQEVPVSIKITGLPQIQAAKTAVAGVKGTNAKVSITVSGGKAIDNVKTSMNSVKNKSAKVSVSVTGTKAISTIKSSIASAKSKKVVMTVAQSGAQAARSAVAALAKAVTSLKGKSVKVGATGASGATSSVNNLKRAISGLSSKTVTITTIHKTVKQTVNAATGGFIYGPGTGTSDSIPAMLSNGEFVVRAAQAQKFASLLQAINSGVAVSRALPEAIVNPGAGDASLGALVSNGSGSGATHMTVSGILDLGNSKAYITGIATDTVNGTIAYNEARKRNGQ